MAVQNAQPLVRVVVGGTFTIPDNYSFATFINSGGSDGTIDFGLGNVIPIAAGESLSMPYCGRTYKKTIVDPVLSTIKVIYIK
jgi:hypothetical protein